MKRVLHRRVAKLTSPQLALVRCWAEGLDLVASFKRYLPLLGVTDELKARAELQRLLDQLHGMALALGRRDLAVLLRRDPAAMSDHQATGLSLDEFRALQPPDFYSEAELVGLYQGQHGALPSRSPGRRKQRLRVRLLAALQWLEGAPVPVPTAADPIGAWLDERVAQRLAQAGLLSLGALHERVDTKGLHWYRSVPRLGVQGAARIVRWLDEHQETLGALPPAARWAHRSEPHAAAPVPPARAGVVPLERFIAPAGLEGAPAAGCECQARSDLQAVRAWLDKKPAGTHTWRAYRKEAERFLLWAALLRRKPLSGLDTADCLAYRDFLAMPSPEWTGPRHASRDSDAWRPFEGPLSARSQQLSLVVVRALCQWLVRQGYLDTNPWAGVQDPPRLADEPPLRALDTHQWSRVQTWLAREAVRAPSPALSRLRFILEFAYLTGLRLSELARSQVGWLRQGPGVDASSAWCLQVPGPRGKSREVPLPEQAMRALQAYFGSRGLGPCPLGNPADTPLIAHLARPAPLSAARLYEVLVHGFERCATAWLSHDRQAAETIREASTHWLRHSHGSHALARGVPRRVLQDRLGHETAAMTAVYLQAGMRQSQPARPEPRSR